MLNYKEAQAVHLFKAHGFYSFISFDGNHTYVMHEWIADNQGEFDF